MRLSAYTIPLSLILVATAAPAKSQDATPIKPEVRKYFETISGAAQQTQTGNIIPMINGRVTAGYYRVLVSRNAAVPSKIAKPACKTAFSNNDDLLQLIFDKQTEAGLTLRIPLSASVAAGQQADQFAEVNLFRIAREPRQGCSVDLSYFDLTTEKFEGPLIRIDQSQFAAAEKLKIEYRPWLNVKANKGRVDAFWTGVTGLVNWVVPIAPLLGLGDSDEAQTDQLGARRQSQSFLRFLDNIETPAGMGLTQDIVINPTSGTQHDAVGRKFHWQMAPNVAFDFTTKVEYRGSIFVEGESYPDWSTKNADYYYGLVNATAYPGLFSTDKKWRDISDGVKNLVEVAGGKNVATFDAACKPALADMARFGFSPEDQFVMVYAAAKGIAQFTDMKIRDIKCLQVPEALAAFKRYKIAVGSMPDTAPLPKMNEAQMDILLKASYSLLKSPRALGSDSETLKFNNYASSDGIRVIGDRTLLQGESGNTLFAADGDAQTPLAKAAFLDTIKNLKPLVKTGCRAPRITDSENAMAKLVEFPNGSGSPVAQDRILAHLAKRSDGKMLLLLWGVKGVDGDDYPQVTQLWLSDNFGSGDPTLAEIKKDMLLNKSCTDDSEFNQLLTQ